MFAELNFPAGAEGAAGLICVIFICVNIATTMPSGGAEPAAATPSNTSRWNSFY